MDMGSRTTMAVATPAMDMAGDAAMASSTAAASMDMGGLDMSGDTCKISMLWNWNTVDACFISSSWQITSTSVFAGSCIGVICLVISLAFLRRCHRSYDAYIARSMRQEAVRSLEQCPPKNSSNGNSSSNSSTSKEIKEEHGLPSARAKALPPPPVTFRRIFAPVPRPTLAQQLVRALLHMAEFAVAYFVMLLAMYFNGYIIISILVGAFLGYFVFEWDTFQSYVG